MNCTCNIKDLVSRFYHLDMSSLDSLLYKIRILTSLISPSQLLPPTSAFPIWTFFFMLPTLITCTQMVFDLHWLFRLTFSTLWWCKSYSHSVETKRHILSIGLFLGARHILWLWAAAVAKAPRSHVNKWGEQRQTILLPTQPFQFSLLVQYSVSLLDIQYSIIK